MLPRGRRESAGRWPARVRRCRCVAGESAPLISSARGAGAPFCRGCGGCSVCNGCSGPWTERCFPRREKRGQAYAGAQCPCERRRKKRRSRRNVTPGQARIARRLIAQSGLFRIDLRVPRSAGRLFAGRHVHRFCTGTFLHNNRPCFLADVFAVSRENVCAGNRTVLFCAVGTAKAGRGAFHILRGVDRRGVRGRHALCEQRRRACRAQRDRPAGGTSNLPLWAAYGFCRTFIV